MTDQLLKETRISGYENPCDCSVEGIVTIDARGQMVLPKEVRERAGIAPGDRFAVVFSEREGAVCCITLIKKDHLDRYISSLVHPEHQMCRTEDQKANRNEHYD
ncbi:AbrB/MazE/SpoVT family DNA-binding domain-containing protein [Methanocalculus taiwanensis]|uniref:AbrB/MazE/SpoVT family DNA-binding domain-containing protein n=1 Tax=Methanocalculus taiwanensis TaxID=106207 RepID=A0ABD4TJP1_9EURY|nr:HgcAB-associated protein [Methanocalculus taiwanensis]MCQ1539001.1 AbrB/MazE/SpoVT family DNA-binding domain-containing protein [Methanocalculus taiwanensis]